MSTVSSTSHRTLSFKQGGWKRYINALLDLLYTRRCEGCHSFLASGREGLHRWLCDSCADGLKAIEPPFCQVCGETYDGAMEGAFRCGNCSNLKLHFDFAIAGYHAEGLVRELVHKFKYQRALYLRGLLAELLSSVLVDTRLQAQAGSWILMPVPLHRSRQRQREYNQAWELCRALSATSGIPAVQGLSRVRPTTPQASLSRNQRLENLRGAFALKKGARLASPLEGRTVLLVDDVLTTGSTTSECARVLRREAGVEKVVVITVARG